MRLRAPFTVAFSIVALGLAVPVAAQAADVAATPGPAGTKPAIAPLAPKKSADTLNALFADLKRESSEAAAGRIAGRIGAEWNNSGSASIDMMMGWAQKAMTSRKFDVALDFLDQVVTLDPSYAEGWNRRATVHFMMGNYAKSMSDIQRTLQLEPRHFGALAGMAQIMKVSGNKELALKAYQRVLDIYPMMRSAQNEVATLSDQLAGEGI